MADQLWQHSLEFLENYRTSTSYYGIAHLYTFEDTSGILERHRDMFENSFLDGQVDMKTIFQELICMLVDNEKRNDDVAEIASLDGFQDLTNRLQHHLNLRFRKDLQEFKKNKSEGKFVQMEKKLQLVEQDAFVILEKMVRLEEENQFLLEKVNILEKSEKQYDYKTSGEQRSLIEKLHYMAEKHEKEISKFLNNNNNRDSKEEMNETETDKLEKDNKTLRDDFNFQEQFETFENEISELTELRILEISDEVTHIAKQMKQERKSMEENIDRLAKKCQENRIQNQTDIISNTKEITKVIENQILLKEKIKMMEENDEQMSKSAFLSRFWNEPSSNTGKDDEKFSNIEQSINGICCELKTMRAENKSSAEDNMKTTEIINNEMKNIYDTIKRIKEQTADDKINENISNLASDLSILKEEFNKHQEAKDVAVSLIKHEQDTTSNSVHRIKLLIEKIEEGIIMQEGRLNKTTIKVSDLEIMIEKIQTEKNELFTQLQILSKVENKYSFRQFEETKFSLKLKIQELENISNQMTKNIEDNRLTFDNVLATAEEKLAKLEKSNYMKRACLKKPDTTRHISFIPSSDDLIEKVMEEDDLKEKMGEEDDLIEKVVDENMKTSLDGQREIDLKLHHTDNNVEDTKHINRKESTGSSPAGSKLGRWLKKRKKSFIDMSKH